MAARVVVAPPATSLERVINLSRNAKIHRHILDVLSPVSGVGSKAFHLKKGEEPEIMGEERVNVSNDPKQRKHLSSGFLRQNSKPVANHGQNGCKVGKTQQDPEPDQRLVPVIIPILPRTFCEDTKSVLSKAFFL